MKTTVIDLKDYELSGGGKLGESYIKKDDPDILLKLYSAELEKMGLDEYEKACKVYNLGLPCPEPGQVVRTADNRVGIQFKRIHGKLSYARALSIHPELMDQYALEFADLCKKLHSTTPPPGLFPTFKDQSKQYIRENPFLTDQERDGMIRFIDTLPDADTALHGDLHIGNVIFDEEGRKYLIDLSEFSTGSPLFDLGIIYLQACMPLSARSPALSFASFRPALTSPLVPALMSAAPFLSEATPLRIRLPDSSFASCAPDTDCTSDGAASCAASSNADADSAIMDRMKTVRLRENMIHRSFLAGWTESKSGL